MTARYYPLFDVARSLLDEADGLLSDAKRIAGIADRVQDTVIGNELKNEVRSLVTRAQEISELARSLPSENERSQRK